MDVAVSSNFGWNSGILPNPVPIASHAAMRYSPGRRFPNGTPVVRRLVGRWDGELNSWTGDSTGRWEGDTLVVDNIGFNDQTWLDNTGKPHGERLQVIERYRRLDSGRLEIQYTRRSPVTDKPYTFTRKLVPANRAIRQAVGSRLSSGCPAEDCPAWR